MKTFLLSAVIAAAALTAGTASATQAWVGHSALNARSGPGTNYHKVGTFQPCTPVHVIGHSHGWAKVAYNHSHYWVSAKYLRGSSCHAQTYTPKPKHNTYAPQPKHY